MCSVLVLVKINNGVLDILYLGNQIETFIINENKAQTHTQHINSIIIYTKISC